MEKQPKAADLKSKITYGRLQPKELQACMSVYEPTARALAEKLLQIEAIRLSSGKPFVWTSGRKSPVYCDNRRTLSFPPVRNYIRDKLAEVVRERFADAEYVAGVATAGVAHGALVADALGLPYVYVRPLPKSHGMKNQIEGRVEPGRRVVVIEDLISTGGSSLAAAAALQVAGFEPIGMAAIFTYWLAEALQGFAAAQLPVVCLSDFSALMQTAKELQLLEDKDIARLRLWSADPDGWSVVAAQPLVVSYL